MMKMINANKIGAVLLAGMAFSAPAMAATNTPTEISNKKLVADFYQALDAANASGSMAKQARQIAEKYLSPDYTQHQEGAPATGNAREAFIRNAQATPAGPLPPAMQKPATQVALMADGDRVILVTSRDIPTATGSTRPVFIFNMFRIAGGKLAEHWDALPSAISGPPPGAQNAPGATAPR
ncbi:hypothetical protein WSK_1991 [Novosphingobium sp. Rr 2-17]|uniref:nuclear transport factor 2 family protein n=1 Tax=Novosphingobium sp. Rr 2-17 TaxID=555793 RepID=UPI0002698504|nr:nuclear transport factor 2 family protein [Novosphingobium sp. Rr 2-17]EIZ79427.1 hypothetical protein WSK_1991 [Novosphingobium sp. Rr 2-17]